MPHYSQHTNEIMGKLPSWVLRWGMSVVFVVFAGILAGSCIIKFPQIVTAPITITTINPPFELIAKATARIDSIFVKDGQSVCQNEVVALLYNTARYDDVVSVDSLLVEFDEDSVLSYEWLSYDYQMGDVQVAFAEFRRQCLNYAHYRKADNINRKKQLIAAQIATHRRYLKKQKSQRDLISKDYDLSAKNLARDSGLYLERVLSPLDYERSQAVTISKKSSLIGFEATMTSTELTILQLEQQLLELSMQQDNEMSEYRRQIGGSAEQLASQIKSWRQTYLLTSSIAGTLSLTKYWSANQNVQNGEKLGAVLADDSTRVIGIMNVPSTGFGRVVVGQNVNVKLNGYPYFEYGILKGVISRISSVPDKITGADGSVQQCYIVDVEFPDGLQSSYSEQLSLIEQMDGVGEIITRDERLIARFIQPLRALFDKVKP